MAAAKLSAIKHGTPGISRDIPIDSAKKVSRQGAPRTVRTFEGSSTLPGSARPPDVLVQSGKAAAFSHLVGVDHVRFQVTNSEGETLMDFSGFVKSTRGRFLTLGSHSVW